MRWRQTAGSWLLLIRLSLPAGKEDEKGSSPFRLEIDLFKEFFSMVSTDLLFIYDKILVWFTFGLPRPIADLQFYISAFNSIVITLLWQLYPQKLIIPKDYIPMKLLSEYHATRVYWDWTLMSYYPCLFFPFPWRQKSDTLAGKQNIKFDIHWHKRERCF